MKLELLAFADECNRNAGFPAVEYRGKMEFLRRYLEQDGVCPMCGKWFPPVEMTRDHIVPRSKCGGTQWENIRLLCRRDNMQKGDGI